MPLQVQPQGLRLCLAGASRTAYNTPMRKHWLKAVLAIAAVLALTVAWLSWIGSMPFGRPATEPEFMAEQLRRARYGGPLRSEAEKAIADALPEDPTVEDLRLAYRRHVLASYAIEAAGIVQTYLEWADPGFPPRDEDAFRLYSELSERYASVDRQHPFERGARAYALFADEQFREQYLKSTDGIEAAFPGVVPKEGHCLQNWGRGNEVLPTGGFALYRVAVMRAHALQAAGRGDEARALLRGAAHGAVSTTINTLSIGELFRQLLVSMVYQDGILFFAERGFVDADFLEEVVEFRKKDARATVDTVRAEIATQLAEALADSPVADAEMEQLFAQEMCDQDFERYGPTSLSDWVEKRAGSFDRGYWSVRRELFLKLADAKPDLSDPVQARRYFESESEESTAVADHFKAVAMIAGDEIESDALLLANRMHAWRLRDPATWRERALQAASAYPMLRVVTTERGLEIWANMDHPTVSRSFATKNVIAIVLDHSEG